MGNVDPAVFQRMIPHLVKWTASFVKVSVEPLPEALSLILKEWETGRGLLFYHPLTLSSIAFKGGVENVHVKT